MWQAIFFFGRNEATTGGQGSTAVSTLTAVVHWSRPKKEKSRLELAVMPPRVTSCCSTDNDSQNIWATKVKC